MKVAISSVGPDVNSMVDFRFGRCAYFIIVDTETNEIKSIQNPNVYAASGAGIQSAQTVVNENIGAVISGQMGPNAHRVIAAVNIPVYISAGGTVAENLERFKRDELEQMSQPSVAEKFGMGMGTGMGRGGGGGGRWWQQ
jgi:predicted Fe-Mo cluster-binding NifX family protein